MLGPFVFFKKKQAGTLFFFFDRYVMGGAQRVHLDILESVSDKQKAVYFTRKSPEHTLREAFYTAPNTYCSDIHTWCDNLLFRLFSVHYFAMYVNRHQGAVVLSSNSTFFYDMLPFLQKHLYTIELLHNFTFGKKGMEFFGLANYTYLNKRLVIDASTKENIFRQYKTYHVPGEYAKRVQLIEFGVHIPPALSKNYTLPLKILYAGRGGIQKRVWLVSRIAEHFINTGKHVQFEFAGTMENELSPFVKQHAILHGSVSDQHLLQQIYRQAHVLLLTSAYEGFPMVVKEAMANGCVPLVTALPGNKTHLRHLQNALLIQEIEQEDKVVESAIEQIQVLLDNPELLHNLSQAAYQYAKKHFGKDSFMQAYRTLLTTTSKA
jgi:glycosyltransferase involved in cell wall biosynthesis